MPIYLDCDPGIDDALAIGYLLAHPDADLIAIGTVSGNTDSGTAARNARDLLELFGRPDIPVSVGAHHFLGRDYAGGAPHVHGGNGLGGTELSEGATALDETAAAETLVRLAHEHPGQLRVLAIGPLTNLALALDLDAELPRLVEDVTIMGGAALVPGNVTAAAEANIHNDPEAAARVLSAPWDVTLVGLDVTMEHLFEEEHRSALAAAPEAGPRALAAMLDHYFTFYETRFGRRCAALHDPLAAGVLTGEAEVTRAFRVPVDVLVDDGPGRGQTIADLRTAYAAVPTEHDGGVRVVLGIDEPFAPALLTRLLTL